MPHAPPSEPGEDGRLGVKPAFSLEFGPLGAGVPSNGHWSTFLRALGCVLMPIRNFSDGHRNSAAWGITTGHAEIMELVGVV